MSEANSERVHSLQRVQQHHHLLVEEVEEPAVEDAAPALLLAVDQLFRGIYFNLFYPRI